MCNNMNAINVSVWNVKESLRTASIQAVTTLSANIERLGWRKCSEKD